MVVARLEALDFIDIFDLSSCFEPDRDILDLLDLDLSRPESWSSLNLAEDVLPRLFFSPDKSVSGGLGGRPSLCIFFLPVEGSGDLDLLLPEPRSVVSGVRGSS